MSWMVVSRTYTSLPFSLSVLALTVAGSFSATAGKFNPRFLEDTAGINQHVDLSMYETDHGAQLPGTYRVSLIVNEQKMETRTLEFKAATESQRKEMGEFLIPCLSRTQLADMGVRVDSFSALNLIPAEACVAFNEIIPQATSHFDFSEQKLVMSFPQAAMQQVARGTVPESRWDDGVPALLLDYSFSGSNSSHDTKSYNRYIDENGNHHQDKNETSQTNDSYYLSMRSGLNLGAWRLRNYSNWSYSNGEKQWDNIGTYVTRAIVPLKAQLTLGDTATPSDIFDSVQMRGALLASDEEMLPDSQRGFAPVVRGIAKSNAEVSIEQNGYVIYRAFVQPGAFEINDLYPTANSGDLTVIVKEADGSEQRFIQPFSSVAIFQREGHLKYSLSAGEYRAGNYDSANPRFGQFNAMYGLPFGMTTYGGALISKDYNAFALGLGKNFGSICAISVDITQAKSTLNNNATDQGQSYRFLYSKSFASGTDFRLLGYKYSTSGFYTFQEATDVRSGADSDYGRYHKRSEIQGNLTQQLGTYGSVYFNMTQQDYWNDDGKRLSLATGYNGRIGRVNYSIAYSWNKSPEWDENDQLWSFNVSIPFGRAWSNYRVTTDQDGRTTQQLGVNGTLLEDRNLSYNVQEGYSSNGVGNSGNASLSYQGGAGNISVGYSYGKDYQQTNYSLRGGIVAHSEGISLSQPVGETIGIVSAPGARGAKVLNNSGVSVDWQGNAVVPYLSIYRENDVSIRSETLNDSVDMNSAFQTVVPTRGAVVRAHFDTRVGYRVLMTLIRQNEVSVPFGATATLVSDKSEQISGIVGEDGQLYISGMPKKGDVKIVWGKDTSQQCVAKYELPIKEKSSGIISVTTNCQ